MLVGVNGTGVFVVVENGTAVYVLVGVEGAGVFVYVEDGFGVYDGPGV